MPDSPLRGNLPGYVWDERMSGGRYRVLYADGRLGQMVSASSLQDLVTGLSDKSGARFAGLAGDVAAGRILPADFQRAMMSELKSLHNSAAALGRGGWSQMTRNDWLSNARMLKGEYRYLANFAQELAAGNLTEAQARARAASYADTAFSRYWAMQAEVKKAAGATEQRLVTVGDERVCEECMAEESRGWVPIGDGALGGTIHAGCRCGNEYQ